MNKHVLIEGTMAVLAAIALAYFVLIVRSAPTFADVLLRRGYEARGWNRERLSARLRLLGVIGAVVAAAAIVLAFWRLFT